MAGTPFPPCRWGSWMAVPGTRPQQCAGFHWHKYSMPPSYLMPAKVVFVSVSGVMGDPALLDVLVVC